MPHALRAVSPEHYHESKQPRRGFSRFHSLTRRRQNMPREAVNIGAIAGWTLDRFGIGVALIIEIILFSQLSPYFLTAENILNVSQQISITAIVAAGMTFVILTGGIDLSVGALIAFTGVVSTSLLNFSPRFGVAFFVAFAAGLAIGASSGLLAGTLITRFKITPFIVTLALMTIWRGAAFLYTEGRPVWDLPEQFAFIGNGRLLEIPIPTIIMVLVYAASYLVLHHTRFGRYVYAVGGNKEAAWLGPVST